MATTTEQRRTRSDWESLAREILPELKAGTPFAELRERYNIGHIYALRVAMAKLGYDLQGQPIEPRPISAKRPEAQAKQIAAKREKGEPLWLLEVETGLSGNTIRDLLMEHGFGHLVGRVTQNGDK